MSNGDENAIPDGEFIIQQIFYPLRVEDIPRDSLLKDIIEFS